MSAGLTFDTSDSTSSSLLGRLRRRDPDAWSRLTTIYGPLVYRWARQAGLNDSDAADIGQEVFRTVAIRIDAFQQREDGGSFRAWLWTIARNKLGDFIRRARERPQAVGGSEANVQLQQLADELRPASRDVCTVVMRIPRFGANREYV